MEPLRFAPNVTTHIGEQYSNYRIEKQLGYGAFAAVYLGRHTYLSTEAAVKVLHPRHASTEEARFQSEAMIMAQLIHPHIVRFMEYGFELGVPYMVMEYALYGSLYQLCPRNYTLPLDQVLYYAGQAARGLDYLHERGYIHCDIKPQNLLIGGRGQLLIGDFGIAIPARAVAHLQGESILGTPAYMAPEQIKGHPCFASDQYALAVIIYELLCGTVPFEGTGVAGQHLRSALPSLRERAPHISPSVEAVIARALAKRPEQRFDSLGQFIATLKQASVTPSRATYTMSARKMARREPLIIREQPMTSPSRSRRRRSVRWSDITALLTIDLLSAGILGLLCTILHVETQAITWLVSFWLTALLFVGAFSVKNRRALLLAGCISCCALLSALALHSVLAFLVTAFVLSLLSALITFSLSLHSVYPSSRSHSA